MSHCPCIRFLKPTVPLATIALSALLLAACDRPAETSGADAVAVAEQAEPMAAPTGGEDDGVERYSAEAFFATTSVRLPGPASRAFSPDGSHVLLSSDASGVFNVYAQPGV